MYFLLDNTTYIRKIAAAVGKGVKESIVGSLLTAGRQTARDLFDIYYLSKHYMRVSDFFLKYFSFDRIVSFVAWYRGFNRMELKLELLDSIRGVDTAEVLKHLDGEILKKLADKLILRGERW